MARGGGFLGRIGRAIRNVIAPSPPPPPREQPPEPPEEPRERERRGDPYREIWREHDLGRKQNRNYQKHLKAFHAAIDSVEEDEDEREVLWDSYIRNMVKPSRFRRQDTNNPWWRQSGIDPTDFKWQAWREAMGFVGKRRSRTP